MSDVAPDGSEARVGRPPTGAGVTRQFRIAVAIATAGRRETLTEVLTQLTAQERRPDRVAVCPARAEDVDRDAVARLPLAVDVVEAPVGLCAQRNMLIRALPDADVILFLDDDFVMAPGYVRQCVKLFEEDDSVAMVTGKVVADGILGPGLTMVEALAALAEDQAPVRDDLREVHNGYGCNMAVRASLMRQHGLWFDERLPLYGWLEDVDFSRRLAAHGRILRSQRCRGVHMGVKRGRSTGMRLGYSQIANPVYMWRKGSLSAHFALVQMGRNIAANMAHWLRPEVWVDRRGRLRGNLVAIADILRGRADPLRIREFS